MSIKAFEGGSWRLVGGLVGREQQCGARPHRFRIEGFFLLWIYLGSTFELFSNVNFSQQLSEQYLDKNSQAQQQCGVGPGHLFCFVQLFVRYLVRKVKLLSNADFSQQIYEKYLDNYLDKYLDFALMDT